MKLPAPAFAEAPALRRLLEAGLRAGRHRAGLPGNEEIMIIGSAFLPAPA